MYPWAVCGCRLFLGAFAFMFTLAVTGRGAALVGPGFLLLVLLALINSVAGQDHYLGIGGSGFAVFVASVA